MYIDEETSVLEMVGPILELYYGKSIMSIRARKDGRTHTISWEFGNDIDREQLGAEE